MADKPRDAQPKQFSQPKKGNPIEIPVPKRESFNKLIERAVKGKERPRK